jgi:hypothetical protein
METLKIMAEEIGTRQRTKKLNSSYARAEFDRRCVAHYSHYVLPQLQLFKGHLQAQGQSISIEPLRFLSRSNFGALFVLEYPMGEKNVLSIHYEALTKKVSFTEMIGPREPNTILAQAAYEEVFATEVYSAVEKFVRGVFEGRVV